MMYDYRGSNIVKTKVVQAGNGTVFHNKLQKVIDEMQKDRLCVDVKLTTNVATTGVMHFTALVLGRS